MSGIAGQQIAEAVERAPSRPDVSGRVLLVAPAPPPYGGMALQASQLARLLEKDGCAVEFLPSNVPFPKSLAFLDRLRLARPFLRAVVFSARMWKETPKADVVHILAASWLYFFVVVAPAIFIGRMRGKRVILNYRGGEADRFFRWFHLAARPIFASASAVTTPSAFLAQVIRKYFDVPVSIVPNIVNLSAFTYRQRNSVAPRMIVARHLEKSYDVESVLRAFRLVQQQYPEASLWIAGTGSQEEYLRGLVSSWSLSNVQFLGQVAHDKLPALYDQCDILLNASRIDNFPGTLVEASAAGLVVVSTSAAGIPFIYEDGKTALLAPPGDWEGLGRAVLKVLQEPLLARDLTANAEVMARQCDWQNVRRALYESYSFN